MRDTLIPVSASGLALLVVVSAWQAVERQEERTVQRQMFLASEQAARRLEEFITTRLLVIEAVQREREQGLLAVENEFVARSSIAQEAFRGFQALNWVEPNGVIVWVAPAAGNEAARGRNVLSEHPEAAPYLREAIATQQPTVTGPLNLFQGVIGFATYFPVVIDGLLVGFVNGVLRIAELAELCFGEDLLDGFEVRIRDGTPVVFETERFDEAAERARGFAELVVWDREWRLEIAPRARLWRDLQAGPHEALLALGSVLSIGLGFFLFVAMRRRAEAIRLREELSHAQKMELLGRLAASLTHDFNNFLTVLMGQAEIATRAADDPGRVRHTMEEIRHVCDRVRGLNRKLLAFARKDLPAPGPNSLATALDEAHETLQRLIPEGLTLEVEHEGACIVVIDRQELDQVLVNLVVNAVDAMPEGGTIRIDAREEGRDVVLRVSDTGSGMTADVRRRIFEPFFTTKPASKGTGIGLSTIQRVVAAAGGTISVDSEVGRGTTFEIRLPRA